jgi:hypothetical protein
MSIKQTTHTYGSNNTRKPGQYSYKQQRPQVKSDQIKAVQVSSKANKDGTSTTTTKPAAHKKWDAQNSSFKVPSRMHPKLTTTKLGRPAFIERGGIVPGAASIQGHAQIICNSKGTGKHPICIFDKIHFDNPKTKQDSLIFYARPGDYIISEFHRAPTNAIPGVIIVHINRIAYQKKKDGEKTLAPCKENLTFKLITNIVIPLRETTMRNAYVHMIGNPIDVCNPTIIHIITKILKEINTPFLFDPIVQCIQKANCDETSYSLYRRSSLADQYAVSDAYRSII